MPKYGIFLHTDCWKYIKKKLNYEITYKNLPSHLIDIAENGFIKINYHGIEKYWGQRRYLRNCFYFSVSIEKDNRGKGHRPTCAYWLYGRVPRLVFGYCDTIKFILYMFYIYILHIIL